MPTQDDFWSQVANIYEREFIDPYRADVKNNPVRRILRRLCNPEHGVVADLGCGIGPLLPLLSRHYKTVYAVDFAQGMLDRARKRVKRRTNVQFVQASFSDLRAVPEKVDIGVAVNSLVQPHPDELEKALQEIRGVLKRGGVFLGILPAMDAVHYYTMLLIDRARQKGMPIAAARKNAAEHAEHEYYDFAFGQFRYRGLEQHFWQPFEVRYRFERCGFALAKLKKVGLSWKQFAGAKDLKDRPPPWDWFFLARPR